MKNKKLHLILTIFSLPVFFTMALMFAGCALDQKLWEAREETKRKAAQQEVKEEQKEEIRALGENEKSIGEDESIAVEEEKQYSFIPVTLKGSVSNGKDLLPITITIINETNTVEGEAELLWYEEIEVSEEGSDSNHSHSYGCVVKIDRGTIFGKIDETGDINATISGFSYSDIGYDLENYQILDEICSLCKEKIKNRPESFTLKGKYYQNTNHAEGQILPNSWEWNAR